ncbi:metallophosphoesterase [Bradyrhizobium sp.]|uniref:metallophosphoesterase n=1 Tax=Bradyrhizobium sp. TaxID=376 RepID=UPI002BB53C2F|nr:metallophosphoesterase [Bradyrhizobium sp.]HMM92956.1 metallophosphoesterase [Bradyrhizobium sp.]
MPARSDNIPQFDELYSVSDLHMGGAETGSQIFNSGAELAKLIEFLRTKPGNVALVINGDMVDFLAEPGARAFDPDGAIQKLDRIARDAAFAPVWKALKKFVGTRDRRLIITLGNHDVELSLPWVREHLLQLIAGDDDAARGRIMLAFDGTGFLCRVGNATVLCLHGNEVDDWNVTDFETIRRCGRDLQQGRSVDPWIPNAGTHLVIEVMNDIKRGYPFVDLLKPELEAVIPVLLAVAPEKRDQIGGVFPVLKRLAMDKFRRATGLLGAEEEREEISLKANGAPMPRRQIDHGALMTQMDDRLQRGVEPVSLLPDIERARQLGVPDAVWSWVRGKDVRETLRRALDDLQKDRSFEWSLADDTFHQLDDTIASNIDFVLAGHTHLERALPRRARNGFYFNSGTWARLIRLAPNALADQAEFNKIYGAMAAGTMKALDEFPGLVLQRRTVVAVRPGSGGTRGELMRWDTVNGKPDLVPVGANAGMTKP